MRPDDNDFEESSAGEEGQSEIDVPRAPDIPPPPDVQFTRPVLGRGTPGRAFSRPKEPKDIGTSAPESSGGGTSHLATGLVIGVTLPSCIVVGVLIGVWIDKRWPAAYPWGIVVMSLAGIAAGFLNVFRMVMQLDQSPKGPKK